MKYKNYSNVLFCLILLAFSFISCNSSKSTEVANGSGTSANVDLSTRVLDKETFAAQMTKNGAVIVDVRMPQEFEQGALEKAVNIDFFAPSFKTDLLDLDRSKKYYLYCKNETRSYKAMEFMQKNDFKQVYILKGGFEKWNSADEE